jgi:RNA polymerase sigma factor (TIGR02999 family)
MDETSSSPVTQLLLAWGRGDSSALKKLIPLVYRELMRIAQRYMAGERTGHTLQTTALIHEAYLKLIDTKRVDWQNRAHFFAVSAQVMRRILVDQARARRSKKRGGRVSNLPLEEGLAVLKQPAQDVVALDTALKDLEKIDPRKAKVVELRFFGGLSVEQTAAVLEVSTTTVMRDWRFARTWLYNELSRKPAGKGGVAQVQF